MHKVKLHLLPIKEEINLGRGQSREVIIMPQPKLRKKPKLVHLQLSKLWVINGPGNKIRTKTIQLKYRMKLHLVIR